MLDLDGVVMSNMEVLMKKIGWQVACCALAVSMATVIGYAEEKEQDMVVKEGSKVSIMYTVKDTEGNLIDSNEGKAPLEFTVANKEVIPGLEKRMMGMKSGESKHISIPAEEAYGKHEDQFVMEVPLEQLPEGVQAGTMLMATGQNGESMPVRVVEVGENTAKVDLNHPLAGKDLEFDVKVVDIQ